MPHRSAESRSLDHGKNSDVKENGNWFLQVDPPLSGAWARTPDRLLISSGPRICHVMRRGVQEKVQSFPEVPRVVWQQGEQG
jgi:hypothetical protein